MITRIRQGEKPKSFKELTEELERKTGGKPKAEKKSMSINLTEDRVEVPTVAEAAKTDRKASTKKMSQQKTMAVIQPTYVAEGGSAKKKAAKGKAKSESLPLLSEPETKEKEEAHLKALREYQSKGVLYRVMNPTSRGEVSNSLYVLKDKVFYKIAVVVLSPPTFPKDPTRILFEPIKRQTAVSEDEMKKKHSVLKLTERI
jgi:hypothetical protein